MGRKKGKGKQWLPANDESEKESQETAAALSNLKSPDAHSGFSVLQARELSPEEIMEKQINEMNLSELTIPKDVQ